MGTLFPKHFFCDCNASAVDDAIDGAKGFTCICNGLFDGGLVRDICRDETGGVTEFCGQGGSHFRIEVEDCCLSASLYQHADAGGSKARGSAGDNDGLL